MAIALRPYQVEACTEVFRSFYKHDRVLLSMATGTGKTAVGSYIAQAWPEVYQDHHRSHKILWLAHRTELIEQAADTLEGMIGQPVAVEKAERRVKDTAKGFWRDVVVASTPTLKSKDRLEFFGGGEFGLVIFDECHHAPAEGNLGILNHFAGAKVLGMTATADRADKVSLGEVFEHLAYHYDIQTAMADGYLCPILQQFVQVEGLDFSKVRLQRGDFSKKGLEVVITEEAIIHRIVSPSVRYAGDRQTIVYCPTVATAEAVAAVLPRYTDAKVGIVSAKTDARERDGIVWGFREGRVQWLVNVGVFLEGVDLPNASCIVMARPTKSRMLYAQCIGRGLRGGANFPVPGKKDLLVLDLAGASLKHKLITPYDVLGARYGEEVVDECERRAMDNSEDEKPTDVTTEVLEAKLIAEELRREKRRIVIAEAKAKRKTIDPFAALDIPTLDVPEWWNYKGPTEDQVTFLEGNGIKTGGLNFGEAKQLVEEVYRRTKAGECTPKQAKILQAHGYDPHMSFKAASKVMTAMAKRGWGFTKTEAINRRKMVKQRKENR